MRVLFAAFLCAVFLALQPAFAIPDAPASVWFEQNASLHYDSGAFIVNWTAVTNEAVANYTVYAINASSGAILGIYSNTSALSFLFPGANAVNYTFNVSAINANGLGGLNGTSDWMYVDSVAPAVYYVAQTPPNNTYQKSNAATIKITVDDPLFSAVKLNWNGTNETNTFTFSGGVGSVTKTMPQQGTYYYYVWANDSAGNSGTSEIRLLTYDATNPSLLLIFPQNGTTYNTSVLPLGYAASDASPLYCWYTYNSTNTTLPNCANATFVGVNNAVTNLTLWANDSAGNLNFTSAAFSVNYTLQAPVILSVYPPNNTVLDSPLASGKSTAAINITTDRAAECRYSASPNTAFENMSSYFNYTNSTTHSFTITLASGAQYGFYIRCKSPGANAGIQDYFLSISVAQFAGALQIDPAGAVLLNNTATIELIEGRPVSFNISLRNMAAYNISDMSYSAGGSGAPYVNITLPANIAPGATAGIIIYARTPRDGNFSATINISSGNSSAGFQLNLVAYDDFIFELTDLKAMRQDLSSRLYSLKLKGMDVSGNITEVDRLQSEVNDAVSLYNSGKYLEGREKFLRLKGDMAALEESVAELESIELANKGNGTSGVAPSNYTATEPTGTGGSNIAAIIIAVVAVVLVAIVLATSIVPDEGTGADDSGLGRY